MFGLNNGGVSDNGIEHRLIPIEMIDDVMHNPRYQQDGQVFNERYEELKEAIYSQRGKYLTLEVTPSGDRFVIFKGGSTRLRIVRELYDYEKLNSSDVNSFETVQCLVYPKVENTTRLVMTATENITRGELCYGEKARAMQYLLEAYSESEGREFQISGFLEYVQSIGALSLVPHRQEYHLLQKCYVEYLSEDVLCRRIIEGRANREWVRNVTRVKNEFIEKCKVADITESVAETEWRIICIGLDKPELKISEIKNGIDNYFSTLNSTGNQDSEIGEEAVVQIKFEEKLSDDPIENAETFLSELVTTGDYQSSRRKTNKLKAMGVENDLAGFVKLVKMLPKGKQKSILKQVASR